MRDITDAGPSLASFDSVLASHSGHEPITERPPSRRSVWVDLRPIEDFLDHDSNSRSLNPSGRTTGLIPKKPPIPLSYWIDLHPLGDSGHDSIPTAAPEPNSLFLNLQQLDGLAPEVPPSPVDLTLDLRSQ